LEQKDTYNIRQGLFELDPNIKLVVALESRNTWSVFLLWETYGDFWELLL